MSDTPSDTPSDDTPEPDEPETVVDLADEKESGDKPAGDIAAWKLVAVIAAVVVVVIGGLAAYHYRGKIFKSSTTKTTQAHAPQGTAPVDRLEDKFDRPDSDNLGSVGGQEHLLPRPSGARADQAAVIRRELEHLDLRSRLATADALYERYARWSAG